MVFSTTLAINGVTRTIELDDPRVTLLDLLRERLGLTGAKKGCDRGQCGACTIIVDGRRINSCLGPPQAGSGGRRPGARARGLERQPLPLRRLSGNHRSSAGSAKDARCGEPQ